VFPNPAKDKIRLERLNNASDKMAVEIRSMTGALVKTKSIDQMNEVIEIGDLPVGMYLMTISSDQFIQNERIIKR
jgi:hypothetical protein